MFYQSKSSGDFVGLFWLGDTDFIVNLNFKKEIIYSGSHVASIKHSVCLSGYNKLSLLKSKFFT